MTTTQQTTFWQFLQDHKIEIPIIQRDYAQGRRGKEKLREKFLRDLKNALDSKTQLKLDFVYGSIENDNLNPLDGQQRLTTLWLLHWYIAYKAGKLAENKEIFKRFTYKTRVSSGEFCEKLSEFATQQLDGTGIVEHITNQTWFFSAWKQDPTIQAMLNMLGGTEVKEKDIDIKDGIEELLGNLENGKYNVYWETLIKNDCPIIFYYLLLDELELSDDLYIKMNARGKQLTSFENFKADLVGYIKSEGWEQDKKPQETIAHKLDTTWTDIFWKNKSEENKIDDIYFAFLNRYFLNALITTEQDDNGKLLSTDKIEENKVFKTIYGNQSNDSNGKYNSFDVYKNFTKEIFEKLTKTLDNLKTGSIVDYFPDWVDKDKFDFIPKYDDDSITTLTQSQRVVFHAVCRYFEQNPCNEVEVTLKQWMRVVWNIVENANITSIPTMIGAIRLIDELGKYSHDIYNHLQERTIADTDFANEQMKEEKAKAKQIFDENGELRKYSEQETWKDKIIEAENTAFFKGAIRFMFTKEDGYYDWKMFDDRHGKAEKYFGEDGVKDEYKIDITTALVKSLNNWSNQLWGEKYIFNTNAESWKRILINKDYISPVFKIFDTIDLSSIEIIDFSEVNQNKVKKQLLEDGVIKFLVEDNYWKKSRFRCMYGRPCLYPRYATSQILFDWDEYKRNEKLKELLDSGIISDDKKQKIPGTNRLFINGEIYLKKVGDFEYYWWEKLRKWNTKMNLYEDEDVKDSSGNSITLDTIEEYLSNLS
jgi:hypothetical protein